MSIKPLENSDLTPNILDETIDQSDKKALPPDSKPLTIKESMKKVINFLKDNVSVTISTPFKGTNLQVTKDNKKVVFSSRAQSESSGASAARLAVCDLMSEEVVLDINVSPRDIWTIAISPDNQYVYAGGAERVVYKCLLNDLTKVDMFEGHTGDINKIVISSDNQYMFTASDDGTIRMWNVNQKVKSNKTLFSSNREIYAMDLSFSGNTLCAGGAEAIAYIYNVNDTLLSSGSIKNKIQHNSAIWSLKISPSEKFFVFGDESGLGFLYSLQDYSLIKKLEMSNRISDLEINLSEDLIIGSSRDMTVNIWYLNQDKKFTYTNHSDWVKRAAFINEGTKIVSIGDDKKINIWKIPEPSTEKLFFEDSQKQFVKVWISTKTGRLEGICQSKESSQIDYNKRDSFYVTWNQMEKLEIGMKLGCSQNSFFDCNSQHSEILMISNASSEEVVELNGDPDVMNVYIAVFDLENKVKVRSSLAQMSIKSIFLAPSGNFFLIGEDFKYSIFNYKDLSLVQTIFAVSGVVISMISDSTDTKIFISSSEVLKKYELDLTNTEEPALEIDYITYNNPNSRVILTKPDDSHYLFVIHDYQFQIIHSNTFIVMLQIDQSYNGMLLNLNDTIFLYGNESMEILSGRSFQKLALLNSDNSVKNIILSYTKKTMYLVCEDKILKTENPLCSTQLKIVCDQRKLNDIQSHLNSMFNRECESPHLDSLFLIEPIHINLLQIYAYFNMSDQLRDGIIGNEYNRIPVINSKENYSPLSVSIFMNFSDCIDSIIKSIRGLVKKEPGSKHLKQLIFQVIEENIVDLLKIHYSGLHKLFQNIYFNENSPYLPNFCPPNINLPKIIFTDNFFPKMKEFGFVVDENSELGSSVVFKKSLVKFYLNLGSSKSLEFMQALEDCENENIYETEIIQVLLQEKWSKVKWFMYGQALLYMFYLVLLCLYTSFDHCRSTTFLIYPFALSALMYVYELIFVYLGICTYFSDFWNIVDTLRSFMMIGYSVLVWTGYFEVSLDKNETERYMLAVLIFISWMRGITYFRINAATRYLIKLLFQVCLDIVAFLIILFYAIVAIALVFRALDSGVNTEFFDFLTDSYSIIIGNWNNPTKPEFYSVILLIATMLNPIISLNLLIAILSDTFERVKSNEIVADSQELASMIVEIETLIFCTRKNNAKKFLQAMNGDSVEVDQEEDLGKIVKNVRSKINYLNIELRTHDIALDKLQSKITESSNAVKSGLNNFFYRY